MMSQRLPDTEFEIMEYIWKIKPPVTTSMIMQEIGVSKGWKIQTVVSLFARLTERGFLRIERGMGRERVFFPIISRGEYLKMETEFFVGHYHKNSYASLLGSLEGGRLSEKEINELEHWIEKQKEGKDS